MQIDEASARFVCERFGKHRFSAAGRAIEQDTRGCAEERGTVGVEVRHGKGIDDGFLEFFDDGVKTTNICPLSVFLPFSRYRYFLFSCETCTSTCQSPPVCNPELRTLLMESSRLTLKAYGNLFGRNDLHGNCLFVRVQIEVLYPWPPRARVRLVVVFTVVLAIAFPPFTCENGIEFASGSRGFGPGFFFLLGFRIEAREQVADDKVCD
jgi:hypothetical protein